MIIERTLEEILISRGLATLEEINLALAGRERANETAADLLVKGGKISEADKLRCVAIQTGIPFCEIQRDDLVEETIRMLPQRLAVRHRALIVEASESAVTLAMVNPMDLGAIDEISRELDKDVDPMWAIESELLDALTEVYGGMNDVNDIILEASRDLESSFEVKAEAEEEDSVVELREVAEGGPVVQLANALFNQAIKFRASDIHIEPSKKNVRVRYRIDGVLKDSMEIPREIHRAIVSRIKIVSGLDIAERRVPQDGRCSMVTHDGEFDFRVATYPSVNGEKVCIRVLDKRKSNQEISKLGMQPAALEKLKQCGESSQGFILVNGPTGSGKTTTLYSLLNYLNKADRHIITVEDPVEYQLDGIIQGNVNNAAGMTFAAGLRAMLRQDPDIILVGESRDPETAKTAIEAALTGHLVLTSLHANDAAAAITRIVEMGIEPFLVSASISCSVAQRLVRQNCPHCIKPYAPDPATLLRVGLPADHQYMRGSGCDKCTQTGYRGRLGVYEVMVMSPEIKSMITDEKSAAEIYRHAQQLGMETMLDDAKIKILQGLTTVEEVLRVVATEVS